MDYLKCCVFVVIALLVSCHSGIAGRRVHIITVIIGDNPSFGYLAQSPAYDVAFLRAVKIHPFTFRNVTRSTVYKPGSYPCQDAAALMPLVAKEVEDLFRSGDFTILISPGCSLEVIVLGDFAREWNVPLLATIATGETLTDGDRFPTVVAFPSSDQVSLVRGTLSLLDHLSWSTITIICGDLNSAVVDNGLFYATTCKGFMSMMDQLRQQYTLNVQHFDPKGNPNITAVYVDMLQEARLQSRIIVILYAISHRLRSFLIVAEVLGMTKGDYVFIAPRSPKVPTEGVLRWQLHDGADQEALSTFQSLIVINNPSPQWSQVADLLDDIANRSATVYNKTLTDDQYMNDLTVSACEVMASLAEVLNDSADELSSQTGRSFRKLFLNRTFTLPSRSFYIGLKGMRVCDVDMRKFNLTSGKMEIAWRYQSVSRQFTSTSPIADIWRSATGPPLDMPVCGFKGDRCIGNFGKSYVVVVGLSVSVGFLCLVVITFCVLQRMSQRPSGHDGVPWYTLFGEGLIMPTAKLSAASSRMTTKTNNSFRPPSSFASYTTRSWAARKN